MSNDKKEFSLEQTVQICNAIRAGIEKTKHHERYTARVEKVIREEIEKVIPGAVLSFHSATSCLGTIRVWRRNFNDCFFACWNWNNRRDGNHWSAPILMELQRCDVTDRMEREEQENGLDVELSKLELQAREAMKTLESIRARALEYIGDLPVPKSATVRAESPYWGSPTEATRKRYPAIFPKS